MNLIKTDTNTGRKPWTQITATIPIKPATTENEDLAVIWKMMDKCTSECNFKEDEKGYIWTMWGDDNYLKWLGIDPEKTKPVNKFVHPVMFETGERKKTKLTNQLRKAEKNACIPSQIRLQKELDTYEAELAQKQLNPPQGNDYHWAGYEQCIVTFKKKQTRKVAKELQLTVKVRTFHLGWGDPAENNGYMRGSKGSIDNLDPESKGYELLKAIRPY